MKKYSSILIKCFLIIFFYVNLLINYSCSLNILGVMPTAIKSHYIVGSALMRGLAERGHNVTVITPFKNKNPTVNWREIQLFNLDNLMANAAENIIKERSAPSLWKMFQTITIFGVKLSNGTLNEVNVQKLLKSKNEKFDIILLEIFLNEAMLGFGAHFNAPIIGFATFGASIWSCDMVGSPSPPSFVPSIYTHYTDYMTLYQRIINLLTITLHRIYTDFESFPEQEKIYNQIFNNDKSKPTLKTLQKNVSLVLLNNHFSISFPRPYVPNMIEVGGMHVNRKSKSLPANIKNFIESAKDGCIYFSMGSHLPSKILPKEKLEIIINTFKSLKQKVLWKFEDTVLPNKPDNVFISDWFPQDDILAHPNIKIFITHGGLLSTTESIYHGVPIIGIPMFADQFLNMARAVRAGYALKINYHELNENILKTAINEILTNPIYKNKMKEVSMRYRDQPMTPLDTAIYWVEYVARHKGAPHLHSAGQDLSFIEYHNIDAWLIIILCVFTVFYLIFILIKLFVVKFLLRKFLKSKTE